MPLLRTPSLFSINCTLGHLSPGYTWHSKLITMSFLLPVLPSMGRGRGESVLLPWARGQVLSTWCVWVQVEMPPKERSRCKSTYRSLQKPGHWEPPGQCGDTRKGWKPGSYEWKHMPRSGSSLEVGRNGSHLGKFTPTHGLTGKLPLITVGNTLALGGMGHGCWVICRAQGPHTTGTCPSLPWWAAPWEDHSSSFLQQHHAVSLAKPHPSSLHSTPRVRKLRLREYVSFPRW